MTIADEGKSGNSSYPNHLHFELHEGELNTRIDPLAMLKVPGDVSIEFREFEERLGVYDNYKVREQTSIWDSY